MRETAVAIVDSGDAQHHFSALERLRERRVGSRHRAVRLDEQHVYADRRRPGARNGAHRSEEHTSELQSRGHLVCRLLLEKKKEPIIPMIATIKHNPDYLRLTHSPTTI